MWSFAHVRVRVYVVCVRVFMRVCGASAVAQSDSTAECKWGKTFSTDCRGHGADDLTTGKASEPLQRSLVASSTCISILSLYLASHSFSVAAGLT